MAKQSVDQLWELLKQSDLLSAEQIVKLQDKFDELRGAESSNSSLLAEWLISQEAITRFHRDALLRGQSGPFIYGDFQILQQITKGRLEGCFHAKHQPTNHPVLLMLFGERDLSAPAAWLQIVAMADKCYAMAESNLTCCHELVESPNHRFAVMEDLQGQSVGTLLRSGVQLPEKEACSIVRQIALGLAALHGTGLAHGEVMPDNIWLDAYGRAQLLHFPLSGRGFGEDRWLDKRTARYTAPELDARRPVPTPEADVYALGCTLYHLLAGRPPFTAPTGRIQSVSKIMERHANEPYMPVDQFFPVSDQCKSILAKMLAKNTRRRYKAVTAAVADLAPIADLSHLNKRSPQSPARTQYEETAHRRRDSIGTSLAPPSSLQDSASIGESLAKEILASSTSPASGSVPPADTSHNDAVHLEGLPSYNADPGELPDFDSTTSASEETANTAGKRQSAKPHLLAVFITTILLSAVAAGVYHSHENIADMDPVVVDSSTTTSNSSKPVETPTEHDQPKPLDVAPPRQFAAETIVPDNGEILWASPTSGKPLELKYIAPAPRFLAILRARAITQAPQGQQSLAAMGTVGEWLNEWVLRETGIPLADIDRVDIAMHEAAEGPPKVSLVVRPQISLTLEDLLKRWGEVEENVHNGTTYYRNERQCYYLPGGSSSMFVVAPVDQIKLAIDWLDDPVTLDPLMEQLRKYSDADRHVTFLFSTNFVRSGRDTLYRDRLEPLHAVMKWFLGPSEEVQAGLLSAHLSHDFFVELQLLGHRDKKPQVLAREFHKRLGQVPQELTNHFLGLSISPYSRRVLAQLPDVARAIHRHTRHDVYQAKGRQAVLRCYLPAGAAAHLAIGAELALLETEGTESLADTDTSLEKTVWDRLGQRSSLAFGRDTLAAALDMLSQDIGVRIEILGGDLQSEGITQNQSFAIDLRNKPAMEILQQIMLLANPDKTVTALSEQAQKLVYVIHEKFQGKEDVIRITTRAKAAERGDQLPDVFVKAD